MTSKHQHAENTALLDRLIPGMTEQLGHMRRAAELLTSLNAVHTSGIQPRSLNLNAAGAAVSQRLATSASTLRGWSLRETTGSSSAVLRVRDGQDTSGPVLLTISLAANESTRDFPTHGIAFVYGLYLEVVSGSFEGAVFVGPVGA